MIPYYILYAVVTSTWMLSLTKIRLQKYIPLIFVFTYLFLFSAFRENVGTDYETYVRIFNYTRETGFLWSPTIEPSVYILTALSDKNTITFALYALIILSGIGYYIYNISPSVEISILIFSLVGIFFLSTLNITRQWAAIAMFAVAIVQYLNSCKIKTLLFLLLAIFFHYSAIVLLILFPFLTIRWRLWQICGGLIIAFSSAKLLIFYIEFTPYYTYLEHRFANLYSINLFALFVVAQLSFPILLGYFNKSRKLDKKTIFFLNMSLASISLYTIGFYLNLDFLTISRLVGYFYIQTLALIPMIVKKLRPRITGTLCNIGLFIVISIYYFSTLIFSTKGNLVPYNFFIW